MAQDDDRAIIEAGYKPQLNRSLGFFSSFALSFSSISILLGIFSNFGYVLTKAGPFGFWSWPIVGCGQLLVALVFAELAGRIPLTGAIYNWNTRLANPFVGLLSVWMVFLAYCLGGVGVLVAMLAPLQTLVGQEFSPHVIAIVGSLILLVQMLINIWGVNLASYTNKIAVIAEIAAVIIFGIVLLIATLIHHEARIDLLMTRPAAPTPYWPGFMLASLLGAWTIIGFEVAGDLSEETLNVRRIAPQSIVCSVLTTIILGFLFLVALTLAIPDLASVTAASDPISTIMAFHLGTIATKIFLIFVVTAMFAVGLLVIAAGARVLFAAARDKRLIGASHLTHISTHRVPVKAVGVVALVEITVFLLAKDAVDIYAAATVVFYTVYLLTVLSFAFGVKKLPPPQSFSLGAWRRPVVVLAVLWLAGMIGVLTIPEEFHNAAIIAGGIIAVVLIICLITRRKIA